MYVARFRLCANLGACKASPAEYYAARRHADQIEMLTQEVLVEKSGVLHPHVDSVEPTNDWPTQAGPGASSNLDPMASGNFPMQDRIGDLRRRLETQMVHTAKRHKTIIAEASTFSINPA